MCRKRDIFCAVVHGDEKGDVSSTSRDIQHGHVPEMEIFGLVQILVHVYVCRIRLGLHWQAVPTKESGDQLFA